MRKHKPPKSSKLADVDQSKRFIDMAREVGVDENPDAFDRAFKRVVKPKRPDKDRPNLGPSRTV
jgi:hypothetical protein